jgi:hypothetical protein
VDERWRFIQQQLLVCPGGGYYILFSSRSCVVSVRGVDWFVSRLLVIIRRLIIRVCVCCVSTESKEWEEERQHC